MYIFWARGLVTSNEYIVTVIGGKNFMRGKKKTASFTILHFMNLPLCNGILGLMPSF